MSVLRSTLKTNMNIKAYFNTKTIIFLILGILVGYWFGQYQATKSFKDAYKTDLNVKNGTSSNKGEWEIVNDVSPTSKPLFLDDGSVSFNETSVMLSNNEDKDWTNCTFELLPDNFSGKEIYKFSTLTLVRAKSRVEIQLNDFVMEGGKRFDSKITKPKSLRVDCYRDDKEHGGFFTEGVNYKDLQKYYK